MAEELYSIVGVSNGFEVWRRLVCGLILSRSETRHDELYSKIHNPRAAFKFSEIFVVSEEWDTNQRLHKEMGGPSLREKEFRNFIMKIAQGQLRTQLILL